MRIAVTAASGRLGSTIILELAKAVGIENVIGIARTPEKVNHLGVEIRKADYNNPADFIRAFQGIDTALLISGMAAPDKRIEQHRNVLNAAAQTSVNKLVYTSIIGPESGTAFSPIVQSNRQTENDLQHSGLDWVIGRNSLYIEPDLDYLDAYKKSGKISNPAAEGRCTYTSRPELALAFSKMLIEDKHNGKTYNLAGPPISQYELAKTINRVYHTNIDYECIPLKDFCKDRKKDLGDFMGNIVCGIYEGIKLGAFDADSDYELAAGRKHKSTEELIRAFN
jgi:NAD(P)H dehydrogenase (quinone)